MEYLSILRVLRRHRILVALSALGAVVFAVAVRQQPSLLPGRLAGTTLTAHAASARLFLDARREPTVDVDSGTADTLGLRAGLLADLLATDAARREIAVTAGIPLSQLAVLGPATGAPPLAIPLALRATEAAATTTEPYVLALSADLAIPIVTLRAGAPTTAAAARLVTAARATTERLVATRPTRGAGLEVRRLGAVRTATTVGAKKGVIGPVVALILFATSLAAIVIVDGLVRHGRRPRLRGDRQPQVSEQRS